MAPRIVCCYCTHHIDWRAKSVNQQGAPGDFAAGMELPPWYNFRVLRRDCAISKRFKVTDILIGETMEGNWLYKVLRNYGLQHPAGPTPEAAS
jgi:hypothetical protein